MSLHGTLFSEKFNIRVLLCFSSGLLVVEVLKERQLNRETNRLPGYGEVFPNSTMETGIYDTKGRVVIGEEDTSAARGLAYPLFSHVDADAIWRDERPPSELSSSPSIRRAQNSIPHQ